MKRRTVLTINNNHPKSNIQQGGTFSKSFLKRLMQWEESLQVAKAIRRSLRERNKYPELSREEAEKEIEKCLG